MKKIMITTMIGILALGLIPLITAQQGCCLQTNTEATCQVVERNECQNGFTPIGSCEQVAECNTGTCIDEETGTCSEGTTQGSCTSEGGTWHQEEPQILNQCKNICCTIGNEAHFVSEGECNYLATTQGTTPTITETLSAGTCLATTQTINSEGACITEKESDEPQCKRTTRTICDERNGEFHEGTLCSSQTLSQTLKGRFVGQTSYACIPGEEEVYWFDNQGNKENIHSSNRVISYNNGNIQGKEEACNPNSANIGTTCGNCNLALGSVCGEKNGNVQCIDLGCKDAPASVGTQDRKHGESWCVYESAIGNGKDIPGSSHYVYSCYNGIVQGESCDLGQAYTARTSICAQEDLNTNTGTVSVASCQSINSGSCLQANEEESLEDIKETCNSLPECYIQEYDFGTGQKGAYCLPNFQQAISTQKTFATP
jgi:hypothetical protein